MKFKNNSMNKERFHKKEHKSFKPFPKAESFREFINPKNAVIKDISKVNKGDSFSITAQIEKVIQTGGPTVFYVSDGTGTLALKAFERAGVRAYPEVEVGDIITVSIVIEEFNEEL